jgi:uncharacterized protein
LRFETGFGFKAPADRVYRAMLDLPSAAGCMPGATVEAAGEDGRHRAAIAVRAGPIGLGYEGTVEITARDSARGAATMRAQGQERGGAGSAEATVAMRVDPDGSGCRVTIAIDLSGSGRVAQLGTGVLQPLAASLVERFGSCLDRRLAQAPDDTAAPSEPDEAPVSLLLRAVWTKIRHPHQHGGA